MSQFIDSLKEVKRNYKPYDAWEQSQADDAAKREYLAKTLELPKDKVELTREKAKIVARASEILDKRSENNCENMEQKTGIIGAFAILPIIGASTLVTTWLAKNNKLSKKMLGIVKGTEFAAIFTAGIGLILWGNSKQKEASRIGRFQAKQNELKDVKNFVVYTPEQIEAAKILAKTMPDKKDVKGLAKLFADMKQMSQDKVAYEQWVKEKIKNPDDINKVLNAKFTPEQLSQGEEDKEIIVNIVKDINMKAEEYSENVENAYDTMTMTSFLATIPISMGINKILSKIKGVPPSMQKIVGPVVGFMFPIMLLISGTQAQKKAASVGRYIKRKEIIENPEVLMNYTPEQMEQAKDIKAAKVKKGFFEDILGDFKFMFKYLNDSKEYQKYLKTEGKETEKLYDALKQTQITEVQAKEAKHLQESTFRAFDKVDEMSQRYSEDTEAGTEIAKNVITNAWVFGGLATSIAVPFLAVKGKLPVHKFAKWVSNFALSKESSLRKFINEGHDILAKNKELKHAFCKGLFDKESMDKVLENQEISKSVEKFFLTEVSQLSKNSGHKDIEEYLSKHLNQRPFAKWVRNLVVDIFKFKKFLEYNKSPKDSITGMKSVIPEDFKFNRKNYKTLIDTALIGGVPILGVVIGIPYAICSWLTNIQKKAGKIGIMKAMEEIDHSQLYVNVEKTQSTTEDAKK